MQYLQRVTPAGKGGGVREAAGGAVLSEYFPALTEFLTASRWDEKTPRITGTVMLLVDEGRWKLWLHDRDAKRGCFISGVTPDACLEAAEEGLKDGSLEWRTDRR